MSIDIHFLNVGHGDCTIIEHGTGHLTMIDINNSDSLPATDIDALAYREGLDLRSFFFKSKVGSLSFQAYYESLLVDPVEYLASTFGGREVFRYIQTHPDMDHMSGLYRMKQENIPILNFWDTDNTKDLDDVAWVDRYDRSDWDTYQELRRSTVDPKALQLLRGNEGDFYTADSISILSPTSDLVDRCNARESWNDLSYVIRIDHAGRSVILPGDAEGTAWSDMVSAVDPSLLDCDVLKAAHHGRESGFHEDAVDLMNPDLVICSVGKKPSTDASDEYAAKGAKVVSTRYHGTMRLRIWSDGDIWLYDRNDQVIEKL